MKKHLCCQFARTLWVLSQLFIPALFLPLSSIAELPPEIEADQHLLRAKESLEQHDYKQAIKCFEKVLALKVEVPDSFHYQFGNCLMKAGEIKKAQSEITTYISLAGQDGKFYLESLNLLNSIPAIEARLAQEKQKLMQQQFDAELRKIYSRVAANLDSSGLVEMQQMVRPLSIYEPKYRAVKKDYIRVSMNGESGEINVFELHQDQSNDPDLRDTNSMSTEQTTFALKDVTGVGVFANNGGNEIVFELARDIVINQYDNNKRERSRTRRYAGRLWPARTEDKVAMEKIVDVFVVGLQQIANLNVGRVIGDWDQMLLAQSSRRQQKESQQKDRDKEKALQDATDVRQDFRTYLVAGLPSGDFLNVRSGPGASNPIITTLRNGDQIRVCGAGVMNGADEWLPCIAHQSTTYASNLSPSTSDQKGWVNSKYLVRAGVPESSNGATGVPPPVSQASSIPRGEYEGIVTFSYPNRAKMISQRTITLGENQQALTLASIDRYEGDKRAYTSKVILNGRFQGQVFQSDEQRAILTDYGQWSNESLRIEFAQDGGSAVITSTFRDEGKVVTGVGTLKRK